MCVCCFKDIIVTDDNVGIAVSLPLCLNKRSRWSNTNVIARLYIVGIKIYHVILVPFCRSHSLMGISENYFSTVCGCGALMNNGFIATIYLENTIVLT